jgi:hypothetical protein
LLQEFGEAVPKQRRDRVAEGRHGPSHVRAGVPGAHCL